MTNIEPKISAYDLSDYDYSSFWHDRKYEHIVEISLLKRIWQKKSAVLWFVDIGGSYGRLLPTYEQYCKNKIIVDYSMIGLKRAKKLWSKKSNVHLIAANLYHLPFRENSIDSGQMIRVLHHIVEQETALNEINRVLKGKGTFILEFPNKLHIKNRFRAFKDKEFREYIKQPFSRIPSDGSKEGIKEGQTGVFIGYKPQFVEQLLLRHGFDIKKKTGTSFFRQDIFKKNLPIKFLAALDKFAQIFPISNLAPSIFLETNKRELSTVCSEVYTNLDEFIVCPKCKGNVEKDESNSLIVCKNPECNEDYKIVDGIYDLRYPKIEQLK